MAYYLSPLTTILQFFSNTGLPLAGGTVTTYEAGTSTATPTWTDSTGDTENSNPLTLNAYGRYQNVAIWQAEGVPIKAVIADSSGNTIATIDQISGIDDIDIAETVLGNPASGSGADLVANAVRSYANFNQARSANTPVMQSGQTLVVVFEGGAAAADGLGGEFYWDASSTADDDGLDTIAPNGASQGRYLRLSSEPAETYAVKSTSTTRASTTSLTADPNLSLALGVAGIYSIEGWLNDANGSSSGGLQGTIAFSGTATSGGWAMNGVGTDVTTVSLTALGTAAEMQSAQAGKASMRLDGFLICTTAGALSFNWAQESSNSTASLVGAGSWLKATRLLTSGASFVPVMHVYNASGSGTDTIPSGASTLTIEVFGASGAGGAFGSGIGIGGGGGSGGYARSTYDVSASNGDTLDYSVGAAGSTPAGSGGNSTVSSGTFTVTTLTANGGGGGGNGGINTPGAPGTGGSASGGNAVNDTGNAADSISGGAGLIGVYGAGAPGGYGGYSTGNPTAGGAGLIIFRYS